MLRLVAAKAVDGARRWEAAASQGKIELQKMAAAVRDLDERIRTITASVSPLASLVRSARSESWGDRPWERRNVVRLG
jgi:hypothetical protein